jgi:acyl-CoA reductase-like NAD-dependent aldehyde dehydrogenase
VLAQRGIADELRARLAKSLAAVKVGPGDDAASEMGPMIDAASARRVDGLVAAAAGYGTVIVRGGLPAGAENSAYYLPSLVEVSNLDTPIIQQEVFGPVATFEVFDTAADAVQRANATEYGLAASVWSRDIDLPLRVGRELRAGTVWTNTWAVVVDQFEEGGFGQSGLGRLNGLRGLAEFQEDKTYVQIIG